MVDVYFYLPADKVSNVLDCGIKLSEWFDREVMIQGEERKCISALLNPKDDIEAFISDKLRCLKLELQPEGCFVADRCLFIAGLEKPEVADLYMKSVKPVSEYIFGTYRLPECLIAGTVIAEQVSLLDKRRDLPVLYGDSQELYINNIVEAYKEEYSRFNDILMYYFYCKLAETGKIDKIEDRKSSIAVFTDRKAGSCVTIRIPDIDSLL